MLGSEQLQIEKIRKCYFMYKIDFNRPIKIHFMGIGGISMSGLAEVLLERGFTITGSDMKSSPITEKIGRASCRERV